MPSSLPACGGLTPVLAALQSQHSTLGDLVPVLAALLVVACVAAAVISMPRGRENRKERLSDLRAFAGLPPDQEPEPVDDGDIDGEGPSTREELPVWGNLDFSIYGTRPEVSDDADTGGASSHAAS